MNSFKTSSIIIDSSKPKAFWYLWNGIAWFKYKVDPNIKFRAAEGYIQAVRDVIVHDLALELFGRIIAKPVASKILKAS